MGICTVCKKESDLSNEAMAFNGNFNSSAGSIMLNNKNTTNCKLHHNIAINSKACHVKLALDCGKVRNRGIGAVTISESYLAKQNYYRNNSEYYEEGKVESNDKKLNVPTTYRDVEKIRKTASRRRYEKTKNSREQPDGKRLFSTKNSLGRVKTLKISSDAKPKNPQNKIQNKKCGEEPNNEEIEISEVKSNKGEPTDCMKNFSKGLFDILKPDLEQLMKTDERCDPTYQNVPKVVFDSGNLNNDENVILEKRYKKLELISRGAFDYVIKAVHIETGKVYAIKVINKISCGNNSNMENDIETLKTLVNLS